MYRLLAALLAAASCAAVARAQAVPPVAASQTLSLERALRLAGAAAPSLDAAEAGIRAAGAARTVAGLRPNPAVTVEAENVAGSGFYRGTESLEATTSLALPVELGGKRAARIGVADAHSRRALIEAAVALADLRLAVTQAYAEAVAAEQRVRTARDQARIAAEGLRAAEARVEAGRASPIDVQRAGVARINADAEAERTQRLAEVARHALARLIGQPVAGALDGAWFADVRGAYGPLPAIGGAGTLAMAAAEANLAIADAGVRLARAKRVPDLTIGAGARYIRETGDTAALFSLSVPLPLFDNGGAALAQASSERLRAEAERRGAALAVDQAIASAEVEAANAATTAAAANGPALRAAAEAARIARIGYREGKFGQLELLDAERTLAETRRAAIDALLSYKSARARLERLTTPAPALQGSGS